MPNFCIRYSFDHTELTGVLPDQHHAQDHQARHSDGGADEIVDCLAASALGAPVGMERAEVQHDYAVTPGNSWAYFYPPAGVLVQVVRAVVRGDGSISGCAQIRTATSIWAHLSHPQRGVGEGDVYYGDLGASTGIISDAVPLGVYNEAEADVAHGYSGHRVVQAGMSILAEGAAAPGDSWAYFYVPAGERWWVMGAASHGDGANSGRILLADAGTLYTTGILSWPGRGIGEGDYWWSAPGGRRGALSDGQVVCIYNHATGTGYVGVNGARWS